MLVLFLSPQAVAALLAAPSWGLLCQGKESPLQNVPACHPVPRDGPGLCVLCGVDTWLPRALPCVSCPHPQCHLPSFANSGSSATHLRVCKINSGSEQVPGHGAVPAERSLGIICPLPLQIRSSWQCGRWELPPHGVGGFRVMLLPQTL